MLAQHWATCLCCQHSIWRTILCCREIYQITHFHTRTNIGGFAEVVRILRSKTVYICFIKCCIMNTVLFTWRYTTSLVFFSAFEFYAHLFYIRED